MRLTKIGEFLRRSKIPIDIEDDIQYKRVTIRINHNGVSLRDSEIGKKIGTKKQFILKSGQFIVSKIDARYGAFGIAPDEVEGAIITGNFWAYDVDKKKVNIEWLNQFTNSADFYDICERASSGITHRKYLDEKFFLNYEILLPNVDEQLIQIEKIKSQKNSFNELTNELTHQLTSVKKLRQQLLQDAVQGKLVEQNQSRKPSGEPASELLKKIKAEKQKLIAEKKLKKEKELPPIKPEEIPFEIPENWVWCRFESLCSHIFDMEHKMPTAVSNGGVMFLSAKDLIDKGKINYTDNVKYISEDDYNYLTRNFKPQKNDIIYSRRGANLGKSRIVDTDLKYLASYSCCTIRTLNPCLEYINYLLDGGFILKQATKHTTNNSIPDLGVNKIKSFIVPLPPLSEQKRIVNKINELIQYCDELEASIKQSESQNEKLLQQVLREALRPKTTELRQGYLNIAAEPVTEYKKGKVTELPKLQEKEKSHFVKRKVLATYIINQSLDDQQFGDVKFEKLLHLSDYFAIKRNLGQKYYQKVAGPLDNSFTYPFFEQIENDKWFNRIKAGRQYKFSKASNHPKSLNTYGYFSDEELAKVQRLIDYFKKTDYEKPEIISTLYAVWNNRLIKQQPITDALLKQDFLDWDENKAKYKDRLDSALAWMRTEGIIPDGWGELIEKPKTKKKN